MTYKTTLENGVRVICEKMEGIRSVTIGIWVHAVMETMQQNGISHFIEHMMFKGTEKRTYKQIAAEIDNVGGQSNAFTSKECTCYYVKLIDEEQDLAAAFGIRSIPTLLMIPMNEQPRISQGALPKDQLKKAIDEFLLKQNNEAKQ